MGRPKRPRSYLYFTAIWVDLQSVEVEKILEDSLDSISSLSENPKYWRENLLEVIRQNIAVWCQQTFCSQKFVHNTQQWFAFTPQQTFPPIIWIFTQGEENEIESKLSP